eukprot:m.154476 g.154476  ORF g.154476 m.154476 type:complete len:485 (-) comp16257_c0_seq8:2991-4445(-)
MDREFADRLGSSRSTPTSSPQRSSHSGRSSQRSSPRKKNVRDGDRFMPHPSAALSNAELPLGRNPHSPIDQPADNMRGYLVQNELLDLGVARMPEVESQDGRAGRSTRPAPFASAPSTQRRVLTYSAPEPKTSVADDAFSLTPLGTSSRRLLSSPQRIKRKIPKVPFKVLDAPELVDDFYLNLVDWSTTNTVAVGLDSSVYLWSALTSQVVKLCDLSDQPGNSITSVRWSKNGVNLAVGTAQGEVQVWDAIQNTCVSQYKDNHSRVGSLAWSSTLLATGSRDRQIHLYDRRQSDRPVIPLTGHRQEVCGLQWSPDDIHLASGGNDNKLLVWDIRNNAIVHKFREHRAAVKAVAWSPHQHGLLASGGGTADQTIRFWNTLTGQPLQVVQTDSQVCNIAWSKTSNELVSTHGYSQNEIVIWKYPSMTQLGVLVGHTQRVLYLAVSPDGQTIVTGAGDETLRFWHVFSKGSTGRQTRSQLSIMSQIR